MLIKLHSELRILGFGSNEDFIPYLSIGFGQNNLFSFGNSNMRMALKVALKVDPTNIYFEKHDKNTNLKKNHITTAIRASGEEEHAHAVIEYTTQFVINWHVIWRLLPGPPLQQSVMNISYRTMNDRWTPSKGSITIIAIAPGLWSHAILVMTNRAAISDILHSPRE